MSRITARARTTGKAKERGEDEEAEAPGGYFRCGCTGCCTRTSRVEMSRSSVWLGCGGVNVKPGARGDPRRRGYAPHPAGKRRWSAVRPLGVGVLRRLLFLLRGAL